MGFFGNSGPGMNMTTGPLDVIINQVGPAPVPIPNMNIGEYTLNVAPVVDVLFEGLPAASMLAIIPVTPETDPIGPGPEAGVASGTIVGPEKLISGNPTVLVGGAPVVDMGISTATGNTTNTVTDNILNVQFTVMGA